MEINILNVQMKGHNVSNLDERFSWSDDSRNWPHFVRPNRYLLNGTSYLKQSTFPKYLFKNMEGLLCKMQAYVLIAIAHCNSHNTYVSSALCNSFM